jgi:putative cardiolipin synthase
MLTRFGDVTRRMHNKSFVVDGRISIIGGRNIGDEYFGANSQLEFSDLDVLSIGPVVNEVSSVYDLYWNSPLAYPIELLRSATFDTQYIAEKRAEISRFADDQKHSVFADKVRASAFLKQLEANKLVLFSGDVELLYDLPEKISSNRDQTELHLSNNLSRHLNEISDEFLVISPYFVPVDEGIEFLLGLEKKGVQVKVVTNSLASSDVSIVHAGYKLSRKALLRGGVELYEMKASSASDVKLDKHSFGSSKASLHAKTFAIDRDSLFVGSLNLDPRSFTENTEIGMLIYSKAAAEKLGQWFDSELKDTAYKLTWDNDEGAIKWLDYQDGQIKTYHYDPGTGWWLRRWVDFLSLFPIESQL